MMTYSMVVMVQRWVRVRVRVGSLVVAKYLVTVPDSATSRPIFSVLIAALILSHRVVL